jgi:hypothetical protein
MRLFVFVHKVIGTYGAYRDIIAVVLSEDGSNGFVLRTTNVRAVYEAGILEPPRINTPLHRRYVDSRKYLGKAFPDGYELVNLLNDPRPMDREDVTAAVVACHLRGLQFDDPN